MKGITTLKLLLNKKPLATVELIPLMKGITTVGRRERLIEVKVELN